jgi:hypothetical protein
VLFEECGRAVSFRKVVPSRPVFMGRVTELQKARGIIQYKVPPPNQKMLLEDKGAKET